MTSPRPFPKTAACAGTVWLLGLCLWGAGAAVGQGDGGQIFSLSQTREATALVESAREHLAVPARLRQGLSDLDRLLERHRGDVLPADGTTGGAHPGAAEWARRTLLGLPPAALSQYEELYGGTAGEALRGALESGSRAGLLEVVRRWPATAAAGRAWLALGDGEWERGHFAQAQAAWARAAELGRIFGEPLAAAVARRPLDAAPARESREAYWKLPGPGEAPGPLPGPSPERFSVPLPDGPFSGGRDGGGFALHPVTEGERVYVSTSLSVLAVHAIDGQVAWRSAEPEGWSNLGRGARGEFFAGVDTHTSAIAPAVGSGTVVAALQIPRFALDNDDFQGITITVRLPERRLFALDSRTGAPLWNHAPSRQADLDQRPFAERFHVAGSPAIAGSRVLVPMVRMQGRVELHVGCFDLASGELLWSSYAISGQRELNMFNRHEREFTAPPLAIAGDRVILVSQLGTVAAFDLFSGRVLWQTPYAQIPLPTTRGWSPPERRRVWRTAPAVVSDGVVLATPIDSEDLLALDLETGARLWSMSRDRLRPRRSSDFDVDSLLGAESDAVVLGGGWVSAFRKPTSLRGPEVGTFGLPEFEFGSLLEESGDRRPRALWTSEGAAVFARGELVLLPRDSDRPAWERSLLVEPEVRGNLTAGEGTLYAVNGRWLHGILDAGILETRARKRHQEDPSNLEVLASLARVLLARAQAQGEAGDTEDALARLGELRALLAPRVGANGSRELAQTFAAAVRREVSWIAERGQTQRARAVLRAGLDALGPGRERVDLLLEDYPLWMALEPEQWSAALDRIEREGTGLDVPSWALKRSDSAFARFAGAEPEALFAVPVALWVEAERAIWRERVGDAVGAIFHWHQVLALPKDQELAPGMWARARATRAIGALLELAGEDAYREMEARAAAEFAPALAQNDRRALLGLLARFPYASDAEAARTAVLEADLAVGDTAALVRNALGGAPREGAPSPSEIERLALLALGLGQAGNAAFERGLMGALARIAPDQVLSRGPAAGRSLREWQNQRTTERDPDLWQTARLSSAAVAAERLAGPRQMLGPLPPIAGQSRASPDAAPRRPWIAARQDGLDAFSADGSEGPLWSAEFASPIPVGRAREWVQLLERRVVVRQGDSLLALDSDSGLAVWRQELELGQLMDIGAANGVLVARYWRPEGGFHGVAIEPITGEVLWTQALPQDRKWLPPILGGGYAVFASEGYGVPTRLWIHDLYRGQFLGALDLDENLGTRMAGWIQGERLYLPSFLSQRLLCVDLAARRSPWTLSLTPGMNLYAVANHGGDAFLVARPAGITAGTQAGEILSVDLNHGGARTLHTLAPDDRVLGLALGSRTELDAPFVFVATVSANSVGTPVAAVHLGSGRRWVQRLAVQATDLYEGSWPAPVVTRDLVVLPYVTRDPGTRNRRAVHLAFLDLSSGTRRDSRALAPVYARADEVELTPIGEALWVNGWSRAGRESRLEVWRPLVHTR